MKPILGPISVMGSIAYRMAIRKLWGSSLLAMPQFGASLIGFLIGAAVWVVLERSNSVTVDEFLWNS
jgi:hypothetical protein